MFEEVLHALVAGRIDVVDARRRVGWFGSSLRSQLDASPYLVIFDLNMACDKPYMEIRRRVKTLLTTLMHKVFADSPK